MNHCKLVSIVTPFYNEGDGVTQFYNAFIKLMSTLPNYDFEIICVDDGSEDGTLNSLVAIADMDNRFIIQKLTHALQDIGVGVKHAPQADSMAVCYRPLGEITDNVRFHFNPDGKFIFLSPVFRPVLISKQIQLKI